MCLLCWKSIPCALISKKNSHLSRNWKKEFRKTNRNAGIPLPIPHGQRPDGSTERPHHFYTHFSWHLDHRIQDAVIRLEKKIYDEFNNETWVQTKVWAKVPTARGVMPLWVAGAHAVRVNVTWRVVLAAAPHMWNRTSRLARRASMSGFAKASSILWLPEGKEPTRGTEEQPANHDRGRWAGVRGLESKSWCVLHGVGVVLLRKTRHMGRNAFCATPDHTGQMNLFQCAVRGKGDCHLQAHIAPITSHKPMRSALSLPSVQHITEWCVGCFRRDLNTLDF